MSKCEWEKDIDGGGIYICKICGEEFFVSWEENSCQCSGCLDDNNHKCKKDEI